MLAFVKRFCDLAGAIDEDGPPKSSPHVPMHSHLPSKDDRLRIAPQPVWEVHGLTNCPCRRSFLRKRSSHFVIMEGEQ
jgi:hypothetical protein